MTGGPMSRLLFFVLFFILFMSGVAAKDPPTSPFPGFDTAATGEWWKKKFQGFKDLQVPRDAVIAFGIYTTQHETLKLTAQLYPLLPGESRRVVLETKQAGVWRPLADLAVNEIGWSATFRIEHWDTNRNVKYRLKHESGSVFEGMIRRDPRHKEEIVLAGLSCNSNRDRGDRDQIVANLRAHDPDLLFFAGDQSYDHKEHTAAWLAWGKQFRDVIRDRPTITIPDDHDIGQGNLWGEGGKKAKRVQGDDGGYFHPAEYIKMVERCQCSHLPDPYDDRPIKQGIGVYYTSLNVGGIDFAILEDRKWKTGPQGKIPQQGPRPDHILNPAYDPKSIDLPGLQLLGERQLGFLRNWGSRWDGVEMKCALSQTIFCGAAHLHGRKQNRLHADLDSNGWPQAGRNRAVRELRRCFALHIGGDQHLSTVLQHGIDDWNDSNWSFCVPAIVNNYYSRWWVPTEGAGKNRSPDHPLPFTGEYLDGFHNKITMHAYANPEANSFGSGYGLVRFRKKTRQIVMECWPRFCDVLEDQAKPFPGWPIVIDQQDNYGRKPVGYLPELHFEEMQNPVVQIVAEDSGEVVYTLRVLGNRFRPHVFRLGDYTIRFGKHELAGPGLTGIRATKDRHSGVLQVQGP